MTNILIQLTPNDLYREKPVVYELDDTVENRKEVARLVKAGNYKTLKRLCEDCCEGRKRTVEFWCKEWI